MLRNKIRHHGSVDRGSPGHEPGTNYSSRTNYPPYAMCAVGPTNIKEPLYTVALSPARQVPEGGARNYTRKELRGATVIECLLLIGMFQYGLLKNC